MMKSVMIGLGVTAAIATIGIIMELSLLTWVLIFIGAILVVVFSGPLMLILGVAGMVLLYSSIYLGIALMLLIVYGVIGLPWYAAKRLMKRNG